MKRYVRPLAVVLLAAIAAFAVAACGSSSKKSSSGAAGGSSSSSGGKQGGTITIASGTPPLSADPGLDFTTQGNELTSVVDTSLLAFKRGVQGTAGTQIMPGLAKALPTVSDGGATYTFTLRPGLHYSNGIPIKASDEILAIERDLKIPWQAASFVGAYIKGAMAYQNGKAKTISGITTNDKTGTIVVHLVHPFSPMLDIFALPGTAPVPPGTAMKNLAATGTIGDGPYKWGAISPGHTYTLVKNTKFDVPGLPRGHADKIVENDNTNVLADAEQVLNNQADVFDPGDSLPPSILAQVKSQANGRYQQVPFNSSWYFWFATYKKPFNNIYARQAVQAAMDDRALARIDSGFQVPDCHLIPFGSVGHSSPSSCPFHNPNAPPNMAMAKALMKKSGMIGTPVSVYGEERAPRKGYLDYFTQLLNSLGFKASEKVVNSGVYFTTIGAPSLKPTVGFGDWVQDFPHPWDFMNLFAGNAGSSLNYGYVNDPHYNSTLAKLYQQPPDKVASGWQALDDYAVKKAYYAVFGHESFPKFYSSRLNFGAGALSVAYETDMTSLQLK